MLSWNFPKSSDPSGKMPVMTYQGGSDEAHQNTSRPGPIYDRAMRIVTEGDLNAFCQWIDVKIDGPAKVISGVFAAETLHTDLLVEVGPQRFLHAEYMRSPERDTAARIAGYRAQIMRHYPGVSICQYAIVLGEGRMQSCDDPENGFSLGLRTVYVRDADPEIFLSSPGLAVLSVLAKGDERTQARHLAEAMGLIGPLSESRRSALTDAALTLATITLSRSTIDLIREELGVTIETVVEFYRETEVGQHLQKEAREEGREEGSAMMLQECIESRFGQHPQIPRIAERLVRLFDARSALKAVNRAQTIDDLIALIPPATS